MEFICQEAVVTADLQTAHSLPASLPQAFSAPSPCVLIFSYSVVTTQLPVSYSVATTQLPVSAPAHPHQTHSPLCPFPISQTSCWEGQIMLEINIKVFELNHLEVRKKLDQ